MLLKQKLASYTEFAKQEYIFSFKFNVVFKGTTFFEFLFQINTDFQSDTNLVKSIYIIYASIIYIIKSMNIDQCI